MCAINLESQRRLAVAIGSLVTLYAGSVLAFNAYENDIKYIFNATQTDLEILAAFNTVGASLGLPCGLFYERFGSISILTLSSLFSLFGNFTLFLASRYFLDFFRQQFWLFIVCSTVCAISCNISFLIPLSVNMKNFPARNHATIIGFLGGLFWLGPGIFAAIYGLAFASSKDIGGYFLTSSLIGFTTNILAVFFMKEIPHDASTYNSHIPNHRSLEERSKDTTKLVADNSECSRSSIKYDSIKPEIEEASLPTGITGTDILKELDMYLISLGFIFGASLSITYINNIGTFLDSFGQQKYLTVLTVTGPLVAAAVKLLTGFATDKFFPNASRPAILAVTSFIQVFLSLIIALTGNNIVIFTIAILLIYGFNALLFLFTPNVLSEYFGMKYFATNFGTVLLIYSLVSLGVMAGFGIAYDSRIAYPMGNICYGLKCFYDIFPFFIILGIITTLLFIILAYRDINQLRFRIS